PVDGGTFPAEIWGAYMSSTPDKTCGGKFDRPSEGFNTQPFNQGGGADQVQPADPGGGGTGSDSFVPQPQTGDVYVPPSPPDPAPAPPGGDTFDPEAYETPPPAPAAGGF
ncbi:MAG TPA: hypothetical protein VGW11_11875, partial [Solirubrobacteraceae bacterium]|nr:hypothetical protein [Solirubrobacteraceae bacterium]